MDVNFYQPGNRDYFTIEVGYFDTVAEIKEKIEKYYGFPIASQTLIFNGEVMEDERDTVHYEILHNSRIQLQVQPKQPKALVKTEYSSKLQLIFCTIDGKNKNSHNVDAKETIILLKKMIASSKRYPLGKFVVVWNGEELKDNQTLEDYVIPNLSKIFTVIKPFPLHRANTGVSQPSERIKEGSENFDKWLKMLHKQIINVKS